MPCVTIPELYRREDVVHDISVVDKVSPKDGISLKMIGQWVFKYHIIIVKKLKQSVEKKPPMYNFYYEQI